MAETPTVTLTVTPSPNAAEGASLLQQAKSLTITDKASHGLCRSFLKDAKALRRVIAEHYAKIKRPINDARANVLEMEKAHLQPIDDAIALAEQRDTAYVREQQRIEREAAEQLQREAEAAERARRAEDAAKAEAEAEALEAASDDLSERETVFVELIVAGRDEKTAAKFAGYADYVRMATRLMGQAKIQQAITAKHAANAIRQQAEAAKAAPILVEAPRVESEIASVAGTSVRSYYSCGSVDLMTLVKAVASGQVSISALSPNMVYLNQRARELGKMPGAFEAAFPGCKSERRDGVTG